MFDFEKNLSIITLLVLKSVVLVTSESRELYNLDPKQHVKGKTYGEVTRFNQVYFTQEANFGSCNSQCSDYSKPRDNFKENDSYKFDQRPCTGTVHSCKNEQIKGQQVIRYYVRIPQSAQSDARYYYFYKQVDINKFRYIYGDANKAGYKTVTFLSWLRGFVMCAICQCKCDEPKDEKSMRSFSLNSLESDTSRNQVVTGIQIVLKKNVFCLKIHQSPLLPHGKVDKSRGSWIIDNPTDKIFKLAHDKRSIHLGTPRVNETKQSEYVVTGVKLADVNGNLALGVRFTQFEISSGKLLGNEKWVLNTLSNDLLNYHKPGHRPIRYKDNVPIAQTKLGLIQFEPSHMHDDVGQSTVPFLDFQPITSSDTALIGVGLLYRGREFSGGFIAPVLVTYP